ncbi:fungal fucose-specific lectin-domain-containing protein [Hyaloscypha sp. PMI_1271]|nr:fungal fucose-specific lectin-domain-containing protein [Hyaloscypha sp. PMI_1271]
MVLIRADRQLSCLDEDNYGSLGKRGRRYLDKSLFSHQVWTGYFKSSTEEVRDTKVKRAIHAMVYMASVGFAAISGLPASPRIQTSDNLALGETLKLRRPVEPGEMIVFQSAGWDDQTVRVNDTTTIDLMNDYGDYLLRISLRQGDDAIVFNSRLANGEWDHEKRARLKGTFLNPSFNIAVVDHRDRYEVLFSYRTVQYYAKIELNSLITRVSYSIDNGQSSSPLSDPLVVSTHDGVYALALANYRATSEIRPLDLQTDDKSQEPTTTMPNLRHGLGLTALPGPKKRDRLGFEYAEHSYLGDSIKLTLADGSTVVAKDHLFQLETGLSVTYGEINGLAGDFYGTDAPISDGSDKEARRSRFLDAYRTLAAPSSLQPREAIDILKVLKEEVDAVNEAMRNHEDPSKAYAKLPDQTKTFIWITRHRSGPGYVGLARINWDHFGQDARTTYSAGHDLALDEAISGNLEYAYTINAFADHFLEDSFSAGHLRTPRRELHVSYNPTSDLCAKYMHDEDCAIGLSVTDQNSEAWTCYGDKRALDVEDEENKTRCVKAVQVSANEIYSAWVNKKKLSMDDFEALTYAPTLDSAKGLQILCPLFKPNGYRRAEIKNRRKWEFKKDWWYATTAAECALSGWWVPPITLDGPQGILLGTSVASTALYSEACSVYFQDMDGCILQSDNNNNNNNNNNSQGWADTTERLFSAKLFTPLAAISWDDGNEVRIYYLSNDNVLQDWCWSKSSGSYSGKLGELRVRAAANTSIAAVNWDNNGTRIIRVYCQVAGSNRIQEFYGESQWKRGDSPCIARIGTSIAIAKWANTKVNLRLYFQDEDFSLREYYWDGKWKKGEFNPGKAPKHTTIGALAWYDSTRGMQVRVYWQDSQRDLVGYEYDQSWNSVGVIVGQVPRRVRASALDWNNGANIRVYFQAGSRDILEHCYDGDAWFVGGTVAGGD